MALPRAAAAAVLLLTGAVGLAQPPWVDLPFHEPANGPCAPPATAADVLRGRDLSGQLHVVTGGDSGIGLAIAQSLAAARASVVIGCHNVAKGAEAAENITKATGNSRIFAVALDLSRFDSARRFAAEVQVHAMKEHGGRLDSLTCNAGITGGPRDLPAITDDGFDHTLQVNLLSHFLLVQHLLPLLRSSRGRVTFMSSESSFFPCWWAGMEDGCEKLDNLHFLATREYPGYKYGFNRMGAWTSSYGLSKFLMQFVAAELARREPEVVANAVMLPYVETDFTKDMLEPVVKISCIGTKDCPLSTAEAAATPVFLVSAAASEVAGLDGETVWDCAASSSMRTLMAQHKGEEVTLEYQRKLYDMLL